MTAREFLIEYFEIEPEYTDQDSIGNFSAVNVYVANSLYDDMAAGNIDELLEIMEKYANYKIRNRAQTQSKLTGDLHIDQLIEQGR